MAEYSFTPQFANLAGIQPLPAIDVTRGGALQFQPLQAIEVPSARPELVGAGIASAIERIGSGVLSGITAKYEEKKEAEREERKYSQQEKIARIRAAQELSEKQGQRDWEMKKMSEQDRLIRERIKERSKEVLPSPFFQDDESDYSAQDASGTEEPDPEIDPLTGEYRKIDFETALPEMLKTEDTEGPPLSAISTDEQKRIAENISKQAPALSELPLSQLGVSTGAVPVAQVPELKPALTLSGIETSFETPETGPEIAQTRVALRKTLKESEKKSETKELLPGVYPVTSKKQSDELLRTPLSKEVKEAKIIRDPASNQYFYIATPKTADEIQKQQIEEEQKANAPVYSKEQLSLYDKLYQNVQQNPLIKNAIEANVSLNVIESQLAEKTGNGDVTALNAFQRMVDPGVSVREGDVKLLQTAMSRMDRLGLSVKNVIEGDKFTEKARKELLSSAKKIAKARMGYAKQPITDLRSVAEKAGINPDDVIREEVTELSIPDGKQITPLSSIPVVKNKSDYDKLPIGSKYIFDGKERIKTKK